MKIAPGAIAMWACSTLAGEIDPVYQQTSEVPAISIEAEDFSETTANGNGAGWGLRSTSAGSSGSGLMSSHEIDVGFSSLDAPYESPRLRYQINFIVAGTYHVFARAGSTDGSGKGSVHVGLNGKVWSGAHGLPAESSELTWIGRRDAAAVSIHIPSPGIYNLDVWAGGGAVLLDKIVLTTDATFVPVGKGPEPTPRVSDLRNYEHEWSKVPEILQATSEPVFPNRTFSVVDYGAVGDGETDNFRAFRKAIEKTSESGGGRVLVPAGIFLVDGPITLLSNVNLHLDEDAVVRFGTNPDDYLPEVRVRYIGYEGYSYSPLIYAFQQTNIAITGKGTFDGQASRMWNAWKRHPDSDTSPWQQAVWNDTPIEERRFSKGFFLRPDMLQFHSSDNILLEGFTIKDAPFWVVHPVLCNNLIVRRLVIDTNNSNNDGVDPDSCSNVLVEDIVFEKAGDDAIAIKAGKGPEAWRNKWKTDNVYVRNLEIVYGDDNGLCIGSDVSGGVSNVFAENITMDTIELNAIYLKSKPSNYGSIEGVWFRNIEIANVVRENVISIRMNYKGKSEGDFPTTYENINIENLSCESASSEPAILLIGNRNSHIGQRSPVRLKNVFIKGAEKAEEVVFTEGYKKQNVSVAP